MRAMSTAGATADMEELMELAMLPSPCFDVMAHIG
jgi:hypothetical protein